jgi:methionyl-tRNA formyltransferase
MGSPSCAVSILESLILAGYPIQAVMTQPDKPAGRGQHLTPPPVKIFAESRGLPVLQATKLKDPALVETLKSYEPQAIVVAAYGRLIPPQILDLPPWGCINVHFSLLPKYRGASCVASALRNGEKETGVTIMKINERLDAGPILIQERVAIGPEETTEELEHRLALVGSKILLKSLEGLKARTIVPREQDESQVSFAPLLKKEDGRIDWSLAAPRVHDHVRAMVPWPVAFTHVDKKTLKVYGSRVMQDPNAKHGKPGEITGLNQEGIEVACGEGRILITSVQLESKRRMNASDFLHGHAESLRIGKVFE